MSLAKAHLGRDFDEAVFFFKDLLNQKIEIENKNLKKRRELIELRIDRAALEKRSMKLYHEGEQVNIEDPRN